MIPAINRFNLRKSPSFFNQAKRFYSPEFTVFYLPFKGLSQLAVIIPKKVMPKRVDRSKQKRVISQAVYLLLKETENLQLVVSQNTASFVNFNQAQQIFNKFLNETNL